MAALWNEAEGCALWALLVLVWVVWYADCTGVYILTVRSTTICSGIYACQLYHPCSGGSTHCRWTLGGSTRCGWARWYGSPAHCAVFRWSDKVWSLGRLRQRPVCSADKTSGCIKYVKLSTCTLLVNYNSFCIFVNFFFLVLRNDCWYWLCLTFWWLILFMAVIIFTRER